MQPDRDRDALEDMLFYAQAALAAAAGRTRGDLETDWLFAQGMERALQVIGEAANRVSSLTRGRHTELAWTDIVGMRHHLTHAYDDIDYDVIWQTLTEDLPSLIPAVQRIMSDLDAAASL